MLLRSKTRRLVYRQQPSRVGEARLRVSFNFYPSPIFYALINSCKKSPLKNSTLALNGNTHNCNEKLNVFVDSCSTLASLVPLFAWARGMQVKILHIGFRSFAPVGFGLTSYRPSHKTILNCFVRQSVAIVMLRLPKPCTSASLFRLHIGFRS